MDYSLGNLLGKGSFGKVYELKDTDYAIKFIQPENKNLLELHILKNLKHDCILNCIYLEINVKCLIKLVCPKADCDLQVFIKKKISYNLSKSLTLNIANGLKFLHSHKIIHGDIKPSNILIFDKKAKISDFSLSRYEKTKSKVLLYTKAYRPPELHYTILSDLWPFGLVIEEIFKFNHDNNMYYYDLLNKLSRTIEFRINIEQVLEHLFLK